MEKSIETIWKIGFLQAQVIEAPKVNNLYNRKSALLIDKYNKRLSLDNLGLLPLAIILLAGFAYADYTFIGIYAAVVTLAFFFLNRYQMKKFQNIEIGANTLEYLLKFRQSIKGLTNYYQKLLALGMPIVILPVYYLYFKDMDSFQEFVATAPWSTIIIATAVLALFLSFMGIAIYRITTQLLYGSILTKINEIVADMEELAKE